MSGQPALHVTWTAPESDLPILRYKVEYEKSGTFRSSESTTSGSPPATSITLTGLATGTEYSVKVRAVSALGDGEWSTVQTERAYDSEFFSNIIVTYVAGPSPLHII